MKILVADDHDLVREGLRHALLSLVPDAEVLEAASAAEVQRLVDAGVKLDFVVLDLVMPGAGGFDLLCRLCDRLAETPVVVLSATDDAVTMRRALDCGAAGFVPKNTPHEVMLGAFRLVMSGGVYVPPALLSRNGSPVAPANQLQPADFPSPAAARGAPCPGLTDRQREVLTLLELGLQNKQIARRLGLSEHTIKIHVAAILNALGATNRTQAVIMARQTALVGDAPV
jgi:DNA-binding NarL/FixJ family response regulator